MLGIKDPQSITKQGRRFANPPIKGVQLIQLNNILTRSGLMTEVFRGDWFKNVNVQQVNWVELKSNGVTDWHCHAIQTDRLIALGGAIKLCLYDARPKSTTCGATETIRFSATAPLLVVVPPGIWHGLRNEANIPSGYLNVINELYTHEDPDNFRLPFDSSQIPVNL
jgi:dTDP-4-dehydrorhamnose 3,5-epimerase